MWENLTVKIAAHQFKSQSRTELEVHWLNTDVAGHKRYNEEVVFHLGAVHVAVECLGKKHTFQ